MGDLIANLVLDLKSRRLYVDIAPDDEPFDVVTKRRGERRPGLVAVGADRQRQAILCERARVLGGEPFVATRPAGGRVWLLRGPA